MGRAARAARLGNQVISLVTALIILLMLAFSGYSLWYTRSVNRGAFLSGELMRYKPTSDTGENPTLEELMAINEDVVGWLTIDGTNIDYPVVQGEDDMEYVNKNVYGEFALSGAIFLSCVNSPDFSDSYNIVYGHHMANGAMFGDVVDFTEKETFEAHPAGELYLPEETFKIELFACVEADAYDSKIYNVTALTKEERLAYIESIAARYRDVNMTDEDPIIALSTCAEGVTNGRVLLFGRLVKEP